MLAMEMQLLREHARGYVETSAGGLRSLSFCSLMRDQGNLCSNGRLVEETRASTRSHSSGRDLLRWKKEVLDKFEKIKVLNLRNTTVRFCYFDKCRCICLAAKYI